MFLLTVTVARGEHTCSFYVSLFLYFLGQLPLTSLSGSLSGSCPLHFLGQFPVTSFDTLFCGCELTPMLKAPTLEPGLFQCVVIVCLTRQLKRFCFSCSSLSRYVEALHTRKTTMDSSISSMPPASNALDAAFVNTAFSQQSPHGDSALPYGIPHSVLRS